MTATAAKAPASKAPAAKGGKRGVFQDKEKPAHIRLSNIEAAKVITIITILNNTHSLGCRRRCAYLTRPKRHGQND